MEGWLTQQSKCEIRLATVLSHAYYVDSYTARFALHRLSKHIVTRGLLPLRPLYGAPQMTAASVYCMCLPSLQSMGNAEISKLHLLRTRRQFCTLVRLRAKHPKPTASLFRRHVSCASWQAAVLCARSPTELRQCPKASQMICRDHPFITLLHPFVLLRPWLGKKHSRKGPRCLVIMNRVDDSCVQNGRNSDKYASSKVHTLSWRREVQKARHDRMWAFQQVISFQARRARNEQRSFQCVSASVVAFNKNRCSPVTHTVAFRQPAKLSCVRLPFMCSFAFAILLCRPQSDQTCLSN